ncbi:MAG: hypothetical protein LBR80_03150 [Deltaproteobacteria bacterium]|nr:hypothetical protein [Deltaproteobacteria bacterium]
MAWNIATILGEHCKELSVIVPRKALSAGTLICLAAYYADHEEGNRFGAYRPRNKRGSDAARPEREAIRAYGCQGRVRVRISVVGHGGSRDRGRSGLGVSSPDCGRRLPRS